MVKIRVLRAQPSAPPKGIMDRVASSRTVFILLAVAVLVLAAMTWPERLRPILPSGILDRGLDKLDTCKGEASLAAKNTCYRDLAFSTNKTYFCSKVFNSSSITTSCKAQLAVFANSKKACEQIDDVKGRGYCMMELAVHNVELPLCDNIDDAGWKMVCYSNLALLTGKPDACGRMDAEFAADCYFALAKNISSGPTCAYITDQVKRDGCFLAIGTVNADKLLCVEIAEPSTRWTCYLRVAKKTGEIDLCNRIPKELNKGCFDSVRAAFPGRFNSTR